MKLTPKKIRITFCVAGIIAIIFIVRGCLFSTFKFANENKLGVDTKNQMKAKAIIEYSELFNEEKRNKLKLQILFSHFSLSKLPILSYNYMDSCGVLVQKVKMPINSKLSSFVTLQKSDVYPDPDRVYSGIESDPEKWLFSPESDSCPNKIFITTDASPPISINYGDSILCYNILSKSLSFGFKESKDRDILFLNKKNPIKRELILWKRKDKLYIIMLGSKEKNPCRDNFLLELLNFKSK